MHCLIFDPHKSLKETQLKKKERKKEGKHSRLCLQFIDINTDRMRR